MITFTDTYTTAVIIYEIQFHIFSLSFQYHILLHWHCSSVTFFSSLAGFKDEKLQQPLIYGRPGKIRCTAEGNPPPQFEWRKNDCLLLEKDRFTQWSDGSLQIDKVGREDKGAYKCSIKQTKGSERVTVYSQVINVSVIGR